MLYVSGVGRKHYVEGNQSEDRLSLRRKEDVDTKKSLKS